MNHLANKSLSTQKQRDNKTLRNMKEDPTKQTFWDEKIATAYTRELRVVTDIMHAISLKLQGPETELEALYKEHAVLLALKARKSARF